MKSAFEPDYFSFLHIYAVFIPGLSISFDQKVPKQSYLSKWKIFQLAGNGNEEWLKINFENICWFLMILMTSFITDIS